MRRTPELRVEVAQFAAERTGRARVAITGRSMMPLLAAGMVVDVAPLERLPRIGEILVFRSDRGLVAHRCVTRRPRRAADGSPIFVTAGDAFPHQLDRVPADRVMGRVIAVWSSAAAGARRIDGRSFAARGAVLAHSRTLRVASRLVRRYAKMFVDPREAWRPGMFSALTAATQAFERGEFARGLEALRPFPVRDVVDLIKRHHLGGLMWHWLREAARAQEPVPEELFEALRRIQWTNALRAGRVLACVRDVRDRFAEANVPCVMLKGGARLAAGDAWAELHYAGDLDVLVPSDSAGRAVEALRAAGYVDMWSAERRAQYSEHHHREPLRSPEHDVPVEIHTALAARPLVSEDLSFARFAPYVRGERGPAGAVDVLGPVEAALHLAYHGRDLRAWRDIVLLARSLRAFSDHERRRFDAYVAAEKHDGVRLASAVAAADEIAFGRTARARDVRRYLRWAQVREEMPRATPYNIVESLAGGSRVTMLRCDHSPNTKIWLLMCAREIVFLPAILRVLVARWARARMRKG